MSFIVPVDVSCHLCDVTRGAYLSPRAAHSGVGRARSVGIETVVSEGERGALLFQVVNNKGEVLLVLERAKGGNLEDYLLKCGCLGEMESCHFFQQILATLSHGHAQGVAHRDLKPEKLLLDQHQNIKLADFGLSAQFSGAALLNTPCGSPEFMVPEILHHQEYSGPSVDVWSLGVVLYEMVTGELPFKGTSLGELRGRVLSGVYHEPHCLSQQCQDLLRMMMTLDPQSRSNLDSIIQLTWVGLTN
ncbi:5'-AMP-activated protein kinase catalytic subunit alpha-1-like [Talpa occidentalis]|uniref:5'-AMP-activated protein kinase catalytic subunit alpha-1-like n=1 Tax=Talpa occidentalis TaxID=50954 RepID=UPI0023FA10A1|nr:5'-AMP-activated protein kinase catalytic subunit alpha-1-like [Talpa occidentalis]